ncbi:MAG TPA: hypothetical protein VK939_16465 [Longimicrobiales bacterium]|nr:hypothetical protein [Longimicrobiales bacterium]
MRRCLPVLLLALATPALAQQTTLPAQDRALPGSATTVYRVGADEGESWELLSNVSGVDFDRNDNLHILDAGNHRVVVLDARGRFLRSFGKRGGGPGELLAPTALAVLDDGTVAVADIGRGAISLFAADGTFRKNLPFADSLGHPPPETPGGITSLAAYPRGGVAVYGGMRLQIGGPGGPPPAPTTSVPVYALPLDGDPRVIHRVSRDAPVVRTDGGAEQRRMRMAPRAFAPQPAWGVLPDGGVAALQGPGYQVQVTGPDGGVARTLARPIEPRRVTKQDQDRARDVAAERMRTGAGMVRMEVRAGPGGTDRSVSTGSGGGRGLGEAEIRELLQDMQFADVVPVIAGLRTDPQGRIWVARTARQYGEDGPIDLLTADGRYLGTTAPQALPDAISRSGLAAWIVRDDMDVEQVVVKRLPDWR